MRHMKHMAGCVVLIGVLVLVRVADGIPGWLIGVVLLACPVVMIWMVVSMSGAILKRGHDLATVLKILEKRPKLRVV